MDNLTHALAGVAVAQGALARLPEPERTRLWTPVHVGAIVASNAPDLDLVYTEITGGRLGYLLHHRGHTHTFLVAAVFGVVVAAALLGLARRRGPPISRGATMSVFGVALACSWLHLAMDYTNTYGVHPWWPLDNRWFYGDLVFIIEPWLFCALSIPAAFMVRTRAMRWLLAVATLAIVALPWALPLPRASAALVLAWAAAWALLWARLAPLAAPLQGWTLVAWLAGIASFYGLSVAAHRRAVAMFSETMRAPLATTGETVLEVMSAPLPATPWCRDLIVASTDDARFILRVGRQSLLPRWITAEQCPLVRPHPTAPLQPVPDESTPTLHFDGRIDLPREALQRLSGDCWAAAYLRFARAPFWVPSTQMLGDLRFDREAGPDFPEMPLPQGVACPRFVPAWTAPRQDAIDALR